MRTGCMRDLHQLALGHLGSAAQKAADEAQVQSTSTWGSADSCNGSIVPNIYETFSRNSTTMHRMDEGPASAGAGALGSAAQKAAGEAQAESMSTRGFISPDRSNSPNTAPAAGDVPGARIAVFCNLGVLLSSKAPQWYTLFFQILALPKALNKYLLED